MWFKGPAWRPGDLPPKSDADWRQAKYDPTVSVFAKAYTFVQFWVITYASLELQTQHLELPRSLGIFERLHLVGACRVCARLLAGGQKARIGPRMGAAGGATHADSCRPSGVAW